MICIQNKTIPNALDNNVKKNHPELFAQDCINNKVSRSIAISHCITAALLKKSKRSQKQSEGHQHDMITTIKEISRRIDLYKYGVIQI